MRITHPLRKVIIPTVLLLTPCALNAHSSKQGALLPILDPVGNIILYIIGAAALGVVFWALRRAREEDDNVDLTEIAKDKTYAWIGAVTLIVTVILYCLKEYLLNH